MTFCDWQQLTPEQASQEVHRRVQTRLSAAQRRAVIAWLWPEAELVSRFRAAQRQTPLSGVPFLAKDLFDFAGTPTFAGSSFLPEVRPAGAANGALARALHAAGMVFCGKTHLHEFAYGITGENPTYGDCEHPRFPGRTTGGSSSGSAAAVAAGVVPFALGTDTGGSVRVPAAFCGVYGFRLTPRDPWISDAVALAPTFDTAGWFTATAGDMRLALETLVGASSRAESPRGCYLEMPDLDPEVATVCRSAAARIASPAAPSLAASLHQGFVPALESYHTIVSLEAWEAHRSWADQYRDRYSPVVWQRLSRVHSLTRAQIDAAPAALAGVRQVWADFFREHDFLAMPAAPTVAPTMAECTPHLRTRVITLTAPASLGGRPVLTVPLALPSGLTAGLQIVLRDPQSPTAIWALERFA